MKLVDVSVKRPVGVIMLVIAVLVLGGISLKNLAIDLYPDINVPVAVVATTYQGAAPQEVEQLVTRPVESAVSSIQGVDSVQSVSSPSASLVILMFDWGVKVDDAMNDIRERIDRVAGMLPEGAERPSIMRFDPQQMPVMWIGLSGADPDRLQDIADDELVPFFERVDGVASVDIEGSRQREIQVELDQARLSLYGVTAGQIVQALGTENSNASAGNLTRGSQDLQVRIDGEFKSLSDIEKTPIMTPSGQSITVGDVATIKDAHKEMLTVAKVNDEEALVLTIMKQSDANTVKVSDEMTKAIGQMQNLLDREDVKLSVIMDTSIFIRQSMNTVVNNMLMGAVLSVLILLLFLRSVRTTLVIGLSIPIAIISTFTLMYFTGETLNILSMGGLALGIGMMVDSSIVILENIFSKRQKGMPIIQAATEGASELAPAVIASTLTSVVVFAPIVFVEGLAAELFRPLAMTVAFALFTALAASLTLIPMLSSKLLKGKAIKFEEDDEEKVRGFNKLLFKLKNFYGRVLEWSLKHRKTVVFSTIGLIAGSLALATMIGTAFIPPSDQGQIQINVKTQSGSQLAETGAVVSEINEHLHQFDDIIETNYVTVGGGNNGFSSSSNQAAYIIQLVDPKEREMTTSEFLAATEALLNDIPGVEITVSELDPGLGAGTPIQVNISGPELDVLSDLAYQVMWIAEEVEGTFNVDSSVAEGRPELQIVVNRDVLSSYGLTYQQVMNEVRLGFDGQTATRYREDGSEYDVRVMLPEESRTSIRDLETMVIKSNTGADIPLSAVAELKQVQGPTEINRMNQQRQVQVTSEIRDRDLGSVSAELQQKVDQLNLPEGYRISMGGQGEDMAESFESLAIALLLAIFLVYLVMAVQFESFLYPFIIMFSLPTTLVGVLVGLFITGHPLSIPAFIGVIMLSGIVVNNAIVLVSYINILRDEGVDRWEALIEAGKSRLRPILMTTLTTVLAMVPLSLGLGQGAEAQAPMAVVIIFGLMFSTVFTLVLIPVVYTLLDDLSQWTKRLFTRKKQQTGEVDVAE
ncbi:efflux RND transporter permease subunit [Anaerobacillus sp. MEB173]|uniref:efflux RND transporter permease subunit n=1 Tax=Anaerobacillus sp. MEB173 TaxID=3383345 RepID=UPI003F93D807